MKKRVLVCDDDPSILEITRLILEDQGYEVIIDDGKKVIEKAQINKPDLILLDVLLGRQSGIEIAKTIKENSGTSNIPIILISAVVDLEDRIKDSKADGFLRKPFQIIELERITHNYLDNGIYTT